MAPPESRGLAAARPPAALALLLLACSSQTQGSSQEPPGDGGATSTVFATQFFLGSDASGERTVQCIPTPLVPGDAGPLSCQVAVALPGAGSESSCASQGLQAPADAVLTQLRAEGEAAWQGAGDGGSQRPSLAQVPICVLPQLAAAAAPSAGVPCDVDAPAAGFCLVAGVAAGPCVTGVALSQDGLPSGTMVLVQCEQQSE